MEHTQIKRWNREGEKKDGENAVCTCAYYCSVWRINRESNKREQPQKSRDGNIYEGALIFSPIYEPRGHAESHFKNKQIVVTSMHSKTSTEDMKGDSHWRVAGTLLHLVLNSSLFLFRWISRILSFWAARTTHKQRTLKVYHYRSCTNQTWTCGGGIQEHRHVHTYRVTIPGNQNNPLPRHSNRLIHG